MKSSRSSSIISTTKPPVSKRRAIVGPFNGDRMVPTTTAKDAELSNAQLVSTSEKLSICAGYQEQITGIFLNTSFSTLNSNFVVPYAIKIVKGYDLPELDHNRMFTPITWGGLLYFALGESIYSLAPNTEQLAKFDVPRQPQKSEETEETPATTLSFNQSTRTLLATRNNDELISLSAGGRILSRYKTNASYNLAIANNSNGTFHLFSTISKLGCTYDPRTKTIDQVFKLKHRPLGAVYQGDALIVATRECIQRYDLRTLACEEFPLKTSAEGVISLSPDRRRLAIGCGRTLHVVDATNGGGIAENRYYSNIKSAHWLNNSTLFFSSGRQHSVAAIKDNELTCVSKEVTGYGDHLHSAQNPKNACDVMTTVKNEQLSQPELLLRWRLSPTNDTSIEDTPVKPDFHSTLSI